MIFDQDPQSWQDLQLLTAQIFTEMGCKPELEKNVVLVRGSVEIDVYVQDNTHTPPLILICECKYWSKKIPKQVVHAFRTVASDLGANRGYIISKAGFQKGAIEAAQNSNIVLLNWLDFQQTFYTRWVQSMTERLYKYADVIFDYMDVLAERMKDIEWTTENKSRHKNLMIRSAIYICANQWANSFESGIKFPLTINNPLHPNGDTVNLKNHRAYFDLAFSAAPSLIAEWQSFFSEGENEIMKV